MTFTKRHANALTILVLLVSMLFPAAQPAHALSLSCQQLQAVRFGFGINAGLGSVALGLGLAIPGGQVVVAAFALTAAVATFAYAQSCSL